MALSAGSVEIRLFAELARLQSDMKKANKVVEDAMGGIQKTVKATTSVFNTMAGAFSAGQIIKLADDYKRFDAQLKLSSKSLREYGEAYNNVIRIGRTAQSDIGAIGVLYARLNNNLRDFNVTQNQVASITETISLALRTNNATVQETNSVMLQLSQSFGSGKLNGQEFLAVAEGAPMLLRQLATSLKVPYGALKDLSAQGLITRDALLKAWSDPAYLAALRQQVKEVGTVTSAVTVFANNLKQYIGEADKATGTTKLLSSGIMLLADSINVLVSGALAYAAIAFIKYAESFWASYKASQAATAQKVIAAKVELSLAQAAYASGASVTKQTAAMANNAAATTMATSNTARLAAAERALAAATDLATIAKSKFNAVLSVFGGWIGLSITAVILFGDTIYEWVKRTAGFTPALAEMRKEMERIKGLTSAGISSSDPMGDQKKSVDDLNKSMKEAIRLRDLYHAIASEGTLSGFNLTVGELAGLGSGGVKNAILAAEAQANIAIELKNRIEEGNLKIEASTLKVSEEYANLSKKLVTAAERLAEYKANQELVNYELSKGAITQAEATAKLALLKDQYDKATGAAKTLKQVNSDALKELQDQIQAEQDLIDETAIAYAALRDAQAEARNEVILGSLDRNEKLREEIESSREVALSLQLGTRAYSELEFARLRDAIATNEQIIANAKLNGATEDAIKYAETYNETLKDQLKLKEELADVKRIEKSFNADAKRIEDLEETRVKATKDANAEIERANDRLYSNLARSITDSIVRGFENGLSFIDNFKQAIANAFKSFFVNVGVNFVQGALEQTMGSVTKGIFGSIAGAFSGSAVAGTDGVGAANLLDQAKNVFDVVTKGFDAANIAFEQGIQSFGTALTSFGSIGESLGGAIAQYSGAIASTLPYAGAILKLAQGDVTGAAFTAVGTLLGSYFGPVGGAIGGAIGSFVGGLFGGEDIPMTGDQAKTTFEAGKLTTKVGTFGESSMGGGGALQSANEIFAQSLGALMESFGDTTKIVVESIYRSRTNTQGFLYVNGRGVQEGSQKDISLEDFLKKMLGAGLAEAVKRSTGIPLAIRELFEGIKDHEKVQTMIGAVIALNNASVQLSDRFGLTVENAAKLSKETGLLGDDLVAFINKLSGVAQTVKTPAQQILEYKAALTGLLGGSLPATIDAFDSVLKSFDTTTVAGRALFLEMFNLRDAFLQFTTAIDNVKKGVNDAIFGLLTPEQQSLRNRARLEEEFAKFNLAVPKTTQQLIAMGEGIDYTTEAGLTLALAFPTLVQAFQAVNSEVLKLNSALNPNAFRTFTDFVIAKSYAAYGQAIPAANMPSYAVGTPYVPNDGVAMLHRGEAVLTRSENASMSVNSGRMVSLLGTLITKVSGLEYDMKRTADSSQRTVAELEDITGGYVTINTQAA